MIKTVPLFLFLSIGTVSDIRKRTLPVFLIVVFGAIGLLISLTADPLNTCTVTGWVSALLPGAVFIGISLISEGKKGMGDALAMLVIGIFLGGRESVLSILYAMLAASVVSIGLLAFKKASRKTELPFMLFLFLGCILERTGLLI